MISQNQNLICGGFILSIISFRSDFRRFDALNMDEEELKAKKQMLEAETPGQRHGFAVFATPPIFLKPYLIVLLVLSCLFDPLVLPSLSQPILGVLVIGTASYLSSQH